MLIYSLGVFEVKFDGWYIFLFSWKSPVSGVFINVGTLYNNVRVSLSTAFNDTVTGLLLSWYPSGASTSVIVKHPGGNTGSFAAFSGASDDGTVFPFGNLYLV